MKKTNFVYDLEDVIKALHIKDSLRNIKGLMDNMLNIKKHDFDEMIENLKILDSAMIHVIEDYLGNIGALINESKKANIKIPEDLFLKFEIAIDNSDTVRMKELHSKLEELILVD